MEVASHGFVRDFPEHRPKDCNERSSTAASAASAVAGFFLLLAPLSIATAAAPQLKTSAPGYYRMMLGDFEVTALSDGTVDLKMERSADQHPAARIRSALAKQLT